MAVKVSTGSATGSQLPQIAGVEGSAVTADINMTPMIDIMLVLLIIFMIVTPALGGYAVMLPKAVTAEEETDDRVTLGIDLQGRYYIDEQPGAIPPDLLTNVLRDAYSNRPDDYVLYLKADQGVEYAHVLTAIDAARQVGVARIGAITEQQSDPTAETNRR